MILKIFGASAIIIVSAASGYMHANGMRRRIVFLENLGHDILMLKSKIESRTKLSQAFFELAKESDCGEFWSEWKKQSDKYGIIRGCEKSLVKVANIYNLHKTDKRTISMLSGALGTTDIKSQLKHIDYISGMIEVILKNARDDYLKDSRIYKTGGVLIGFVTVLLII